MNFTEFKSVPTIHGYKVEDGDIFSVESEYFFNHSILWSKHYQIVGTYKQRFKKKFLWFHIPELHKRTMIKIMYMEEI